MRSATLFAAPFSRAVQFLFFWRFATAFLDNFPPLDRGVGAKGAKAGSDIGTRVGGAGMYIGAWFTNTTQSVFGGRERDDIAGQLYSMWSSVEVRAMDNLSLNGARARICLFVCLFVCIFLPFFLSGRRYEHFSCSCVI